MDVCRANLCELTRVWSVKGRDAVGLEVLFLTKPKAVKLVSTLTATARKDDRQTHRTRGSCPNAQAPVQRGAYPVRKTLEKPQMELEDVIFQIDSVYFCSPCFSLRITSLSVILRVVLEGHSQDAEYLNISGFLSIREARTVTPNVPQTPNIDYILLTSWLTRGSPQSS